MKLPCVLHLLKLRPDGLDLLDDNMLRPHLGGQVGNAPCQGDHMALKPLKPFGVVFVLAGVSAFPFVFPIFLFIVKMSAPNTRHAWEAGHTSVHFSSCDSSFDIPVYWWSTKLS